MSEEIKPTLASIDGLRFEYSKLLSENIQLRKVLNQVLNEVDAACGKNKMLVFSEEIYTNARNILNKKP